MRRTSLLWTLLACLTSASFAHGQPSDSAILAQANNQFAFDLYRQLAKKPGNKFFSPYSISTALGMTYAGARNKTAQDMARTLHFTLENDRLHPAFGALIDQMQGAKVKGRKFQLYTANALWAAKGLDIRPEFLRITQTDYQAGLQLLDFRGDKEGSRKTINRWVEDKTRDRIQDLLQPGSITKDTGMVLTNAIYFKADWLSPFSRRDTRPDNFKIPGSPTVKVPTMYQALLASHLVKDDYHLLQLPYQGNEVSMVIILPKKVDGLSEVEKKISARSLGEALAQAKPAHMGVALPKFKMTEEFELKKELTALGMGIAFSDRADFSGMTVKSSDALKIDKVIHKAFVAVDEKGTEAAAATAVVMALLESKPAEPIPFKADHPFLFVLQHNATRSILFMGRVHDPR